jgi:hypothetical protein
VDSNHSMKPGGHPGLVLADRNASTNQTGNPDSAEQLGIAIVRPAPFHDQTVPWRTIWGRDEYVSALLLTDRQLACSLRGPRVMSGRSQSIVGSASPGKGVRAGRGDQPLRNPVADVVEPVVEFALKELDGGP